MAVRESEVPGLDRRSGREALKTLGIDEKVVSDAD